MSNIAAGTDRNDWWCVQRHGGRRNDHWRTLFKGPEAEARAVYDSVRMALRQGAVVLVNDEGSDVSTTSAPRLRSIW